jgi:hypothetical protein
MYFVQATFLAAAAAVAIPVIVHLMFRSQARRVNLGTLRFLKQVLERNAQRQRIMRWLLLALRMAAVAVLAVLFARPYLLEAAFGGDRNLLLILIDRSASMDLRGDDGRPVERAVAAAQQLLRDQGSRTVVEAAYFDHNVRPLAAVDEPGQPSSRNTALDQLRQTSWTPSFRGTNYGAALNWARDQVFRTPAAHQELHIFTDLQQSGLDWSEVEPLPEHVAVHLHDLGRSVVRNVAVTEARPLRTVVRPGEGTTVQVTLLNSSAFPITEQVVVLRLESDRGKLTFRERTKLDAHSTSSVTFDVPTLEAGFWSGTVSVDVDDDLPFDNARHLAILSQPPPRVLVLDGQPHALPPLSESYFLAAALRLSGPDETFADAPYDVTVVLLDEDEPLPSLESYQVVVLANPARVSPAAARALQQFVSAGRGLIVFGGGQVTAAGCQTLLETGLVPGKIAGPVLSNDLPFRLEGWDESHPLLRPFRDPQHGDPRRLAFRGYTKIVPATGDDVRVLATLRGGDPALLEHRVGPGTVLWCAMACDREWGEWPSTRLYVPLVHQIVGQPLGFNDGGPVRAVTLDATYDPDGERTPGIVPQPGYWQVVNVSPRESETDRCSEEDFAQRFQLMLHQAGEGAQTARVSRTDLRQHEQWHWAALALLGVLLAEGFVANRTVS